MYGFNPAYPQIYPMQQSRMELPKVNGLDGARAYNVPPNSTCAVFDANQDIMYIIKTDSACFPSIRRFSFTELFDSQENLTSRDDQIINILSEIKEAITYGKQPVREQSANQHSAEQSDRHVTTV